MKLKVLITINRPELKRMVINESAISKLSEVADVIWIEENTPYTSTELKRDIVDIDACITSWGSPKFTPEVLAHANRLLFIGHAAGTVVPIVDASVYKHGITVTNANDPLAKSTAELAVCLMMTGAWNIFHYRKRMDQGGWSANAKETVMGLHRQQIGLIGYGDISKEVIRLLQPYEANIRLYSKHCPPHEAKRLGIQLCSLEELLRESNIVSLHNTLTPDTVGMIGRDQLAQMRDGALLVNTARAPIIDQEALIEKLREGSITAALDVFGKEPIPTDHEFLKLSNVICTPHIGGFSDYFKRKLGEIVVDDLLLWFAGEVPQGIISKDKFERQSPR